MQLLVVPVQCLCAARRAAAVQVLFATARVQLLQAVLVLQRHHLDGCSQSTGQEIPRASRTDGYWYGVCSASARCRVWLAHSCCMVVACATLKSAAAALDGILCALGGCSKLQPHVQEVQAFVDCFPSAVVHTKTACWLLVLLFGSMNARRVATSLKHLSTAGPFMCWTLWWQ